MQTHASYHRVVYSPFPKGDNPNTHPLTAVRQKSKTSGSTVLLKNKCYFFTVQQTIKDVICSNTPIVKWRCRNRITIQKWNKMEITYCHCVSNTTRRESQGLPTLAVEFVLWLVHGAAPDSTLWGEPLVHSSQGSSSFSIILPGYNWSCTA